MPAMPGPDVDAIAAQFEAQIARHLAQDSILPGAAMGLLASLADAARDEELSSRQLAAQIARDSTVAARLIRFANSPLHAGVEPVRTLQSAITRMGISSVRRLLLCLTLHGAPRPRQPALRERLARHWASSIEVAALSQVYADHYANLDPDEAFLGGLIHQIGALPVIYLADVRRDIAGDVAVVDRLIERLQARVGGQILTGWRFPPSLAEVPGRVFGPQTSDSNPVEIADVVIVAVGLVRERLQQDSSVRQGMAWRKLHLDEPGGVELGVDVSEQIREAELLFA